MRAVIAPEPGGPEARDFLARLAESRFTQCVLTGEIDRGHPLGFCSVGGQDLAEAVIAAGLARECPVYAHGRYAHAEDTQDKPRDAGFAGFGRIGTDKDGNFRFTTIKPGAVPGPGNSLQAPHILVALFMRGLLRHLYTRIYFSDEAAANAADPVLALVDDPARRATLVAQRANGKAEYRWDIAMQGVRETVFLDC